MGGAALQRCGNCRLSETRFSAKGTMTIPYRGTTGDGTYFVTSSTLQKRALLQSERTVKLYSSAFGEIALDSAPQRLKPSMEENLSRSAEALLHP